MKFFSRGHGRTPTKVRSNLKAAKRPSERRSRERSRAIWNRMKDFFESLQNKIEQESRSRIKVAISPIFSFSVKIRKAHDVSVLFKIYGTSFLRL